MRLYEAKAGRSWSAGMDARRWWSLAGGGTMLDRSRPTEATMTQLAAFIGIVLIIAAIPFGLMIAPLALGILIVWLALRHLDAAVERPIGEPA